MERSGLRGHVVVVTGASSGIGQATAEAFARSGAKLVLAARGREALEKVAEGCRNLGAEVVAVPTDVTDSAAVAALRDRALLLGGRIDVWLANVGVGAVGRFHEVPMEAHEQIIKTNLVGHMNSAHAVLPVFLRQGSGTFINMISLGGFAAMPFASAYSASKFALRGFSEALNAELVDHPNIHVCDVYPAFIDTPGIGHAANYVGRKVTAPPPVFDARKVADAVVRLARRPRRTTTVGWVTNAARVGHFLAPDFTIGLVKRITERSLSHATPIEPTSGNLFGPPAIAGGIDGGLRSPSQRRQGTMAAGAALAAGVGLLLLLRSRR
ncbi:SDR family oxidoreductase [Aurantimonas aggregata]|uniref:SDR family oxidoreductase n=1 Tax=Aurantimonas aggregata TaxID=2047720 RepID=A0A6L9MBM4_9HYPH|nr:SDR family oxidoreductase [Aurantimonas aggregata]NDV85235.1 SDR family oxidoreductase [Aurantimonas aggregata]